MLRPLYCCLLRLHPSGFRTRFADEMLSIFDHAAGRAAAFRLLLDGFLSLARQWTLRPEFWHELSSAPQTASDGIPSFYTIDPFRPRAGAVIHGLVLSAAVFCLTCFAIKYSWIRVLHVRIPEVQFDSPRSIQSNAGREASEKAPVPPHSVGKQSIAIPSASVSAVKAPRYDLPASIAAQNSFVQSPTTGTPESQVSSGTQPAVEVAGQPRRGLLRAPVKPRDSQPSPLLSRSVSHQPQAQQMKPQNATSEDSPSAKLDAAQRQRVIEGAIAKVKVHYAYPDVAQKMADALLAYMNSGDDDSVTDGEAFADVLTKQMRDVSHDAHLIVVYSRDTIPAHSAGATREILAPYRKKLEQNNCYFEKVTILPHNIGYLKLNSFPDPSICQPTAKAAMASLNHADAIIFDLRDNTGGYPGMVTLIAAYLFDHPEYLYNPRDNTTQQSWTRSPVPGNRLADKPVYVLTSASTFSGAEQFSYDLKMLRRATLVGETTRGEAHAGSWHQIDDHFGISIPDTRPINPFSTADWEGTGVEPDVKVNAATALDTAEKLAEKKLQKK